MRGILWISVTIVWPFSFIAAENIGSRSSKSSPTSVGSKLNSSLPRSILERSRTSLMSCRRVLPLVTIIL